MGYFGSKTTSGLCQPLIAMMAPHDTYIETHLGGGAIMKRKPAALRNIAIELDARALDAFECDSPVELVHGCAHRFLAEFTFEGTEFLYCDPPYLKHTRRCARRYRYDYEESDHEALLALLAGVPFAQSMHVLIGQLLSEATLLGYIAQLHRALAQWEHHAIKRLLAAPAMHVDETSLRVDRTNHWIHVYSAGTLTVKWLHRKRGREAIEAIGIIPRYTGVAVHDCWASCLSYTHCGHALCGAHLLRELTFIVDAHGYAWAKRMRRLLLDTCHEVAKRNEKTLSTSEYKAVRKRYRTLLTQGERVDLPWMGGFRRISD